MAGGSLTVAGLHVGQAGPGRLAITRSDAVVTVTNVLHFGPQGSMAAAPGSAIHLAGAAFNERIRAGVAAAKKRGVKFGRPAWKTRPYRTIDPAEVKRLRKKGVPMTEIARRLGVTRQACYKAIKGS